MSKTLTATLMLVVMASLVLAQEATPQNGTRPRQLRGRAVEGLVESTGDTALRQFIETHLAPEGPGDMFIMCSNAHRGPGDGASTVGRRLAEMVMGK